MIWLRLSGVHGSLRMLCAQWQARFDLAKGPNPASVPGQAVAGLRHQRLVVGGDDICVAVAAQEERHRRGVGRGLMCVSSDKHSVLLLQAANTSVACSPCLACQSTACACVPAKPRKLSPSHPPGNVLLGGHVRRGAAKVNGRRVLVQPHVVDLWGEETNTQPTRPPAMCWRSARRPSKQHTGHISSPSLLPPPCTGQGTAGGRSPQM